LEHLREKLLRDGSLILAVKVIPRASKSELMGLLADGTLKVKLAAIPEKGKANEELRRLLAGYFQVSKSSVELLSGETSQQKRVRIVRS
jgi:uncharacterized protein